MDLSSLDSNQSGPEMTLPNASFRLKLSRSVEQNSVESRWAIYNPYNANLYWEDNGQRIVPEGHPKALESFQFTPVSPHAPSTKSHHLKLVKIQVGFGCNYSCGYCSQKSFRPATSVTRDDEMARLLETFEQQYDGGEDGLGKGTRVDFIGGETLLYWNTVEKLATRLKAKYPNIKFSLYTNGSVVIDKLAEKAIELELLVMLSHDGLDQKVNRGKDPFESAGSLAFLRQLAEKLIPHNLFIVQMTLGKSNFSLAANRDLLSRQLNQPIRLLPLAYDIVHAFEDNSKVLIPKDQDEISNFQSRVLREFRSLSWAQILAFAGFRMDLAGFLDPLIGRTSMAECHQRCEMDKPTSIAFDLKGNVLTCQNTTAKSGHTIGQLDRFDEIRLNTAMHWSLRENCRKCPVVTMCRGACMYTKDREFQKTCDSMFSYYLAVLAYALENVAGWRLTEIHGDNIRSRSVSTIQIR